MSAPGIDWAPPERGAIKGTARGPGIAARNINEASRVADSNAPLGSPTNAAR